MLEEIEKFEKTGDEPQMRMFADNHLLFAVWIAEDVRVIAFQLCPTENKDQIAFSWRESIGFFSSPINSETGSHWKDLSAAEDKMEDFNMKRLKAEFEARSANIDLGVASFVLEKLKIYLVGDEGSEEEIVG